MLCKSQVEGHTNDYESLFFIFGVAASGSHFYYYNHPAFSHRHTLAFI